MQEEWKEIEGYSKYEVSTRGEIRDAKTRELRPLVWNGNFLCTNLYSDDGVKALCKVHRIVALVFIPNPENAYNVIHKNGDRGDNSVENLLWKAKKVVPKKGPRLIEYEGETYTYKDFAAACGISVESLRFRIKEGWTLRECYINHKAFKGDGFQTDTHWFPSKAQQQTYEIEVRRKDRLLRKERERLRKQEWKSRKVAGVGIKDIDTSSSDPFYKRWVSMLGRCYNEKSLIKSPSYEDKHVCDDWIFLSKFKSWMEAQNWQGLQLDKDILVKGNKVYSPETCVFIPAYVNSSICLSDRARGEYPVGVTYRQRDDMYSAKIRSFGEVHSLGYHKSPIEAHVAWQKAKIEELENIINMYAKEDCFRTDVAEALMLRVWQIRLDISKGLETTTL